MRNRGISGAELFHALPKREFRCWQKPTTPPPQVSDFSSSRAEAVPWGPTLFYRAPVSESSTHTKVYFANHQGWDFSIAMSKKFKLVEPPILPAFKGGLNGEISIGLRLQRDRSVTTFPFLKEVLLDVKSTPGARQIAMSCMFVEKPTGIEMRILMGTMIEVPFPTGWTWAFDADMGHIVGFLQTYRVSHVMYWPFYPKPVMPESGEMPMQEPCPMG